MRDAHLDNAKLGLIFLVMLGHGLEPLGGQRWAHAAYLFIYAFHMPAFIFLSGYFSSAELSEKTLRRVVFGLGVPYVVFDVAYRVFDWQLFHPRGALSIDLFTPYWVLWYLLSLICWRLMLPVFVRVRGGLACAIGLALLAGYAPSVGYFFSLSRTLVFFPFFFLGYLSRGGLLERLRTPLWRVGAACFFAALGVAAWKNAGFDARWLYGSYSYASLGHRTLWAGAWRLGVLAVGALGTAAFLGLVPPRASWMTRWGAHSLEAYLLHAFVVKGAVAAGVFRHPLSAPGWAAALVLSAALLCGMLASPWVAALSAPVLRPVWLERWLWTVDAPPSAN